MNHQPFESWLLSDESLNEAQQVELDSHLKECETCANISKALKQVYHTLSESTPVRPDAGFTLRWHTRLSIIQQQKQQRRFWFFSLGLLGVSGLIFVTLVLLNFNNINWAYEISQFIANFSLFAARINRTWNVVNVLTSTLPILIPVLLISGVGLFFVIITLMVTGFSSIVKLYHPIQEGVKER